MNSIGTGPGSEIFGILCGLPGDENLKVQVVGLEREEAWREMFEIARDEFAAKTGIHINGFLTNDPKNLDAEGRTIGSFVLSDAARRSNSHTLIQTIRDTTSGRTAYFLDTPRYMTSTGTKEYVTKPIKEAGFGIRHDPLPTALNIPDVIRREMSACNPIYCTREIDNMPRIYTVQLR